MRDVLIFVVWRGEESMRMRDWQLTERVFMRFRVRSFEDSCRKMYADASHKPHGLAFNVARRVGPLSREDCSMHVFCRMSRNDVVKDCDWTLIVTP